MEIQFYKSERGNITVVSIDKNLLIRIASPITGTEIFLVSNPGHKDANNIHSLDIDIQMTPDEIFKQIDATKTSH